METKKPLISVALNGGLILGIILIIYSIILYMFGQTMSKPLGYMNYIIIAICIYLFSKSYRDKVLGGTITYGHAVGYGLMMGLISSILVAIFGFILYKFIDHSLIDKMIEMGHDQAISRGASEEQFEKGLPIVRMFVNPVSLAIMTLIMNTIASLLISLITSAIIKKNPSPFDSTMKSTDESQNQ